MAVRYNGRMRDLIAPRAEGPWGARAGRDVRDEDRLRRTELVISWAVIGIVTSMVLFLWIAVPWNIGYDRAVAPPAASLFKQILGHTQKSSSFRPVPRND
jgi:hypothetical protein